MKHQIWLSLPLAAALMVPAVAQQNNSDTTTQNPPAATAQEASAPQDEATQARQPLTAEPHEGFWGKINPFARKKYVQRQVQPIRDRVNELDELTASNAKAIQDVDARAQQGIRLADAKATEADQHAVDAGNRAQQANQVATQASTRLNTVEQVVGSIDQYQPVTEADIHFRPGQTLLSKQAKGALDEIASSMQGQKGYILAVQGFSAGKGQVAIANSQRLAQSVVRYMVLNHDIPVYRIYLVGMGNAPVPATTEGMKAQRTRSGGRVEVSLLRNNVDQLANVTPGSAGVSTPGTQGGMSGTSAQPTQQSAPQPSMGTQQPSSNMNPPAYQPGQQTQPRQ